MQSAHRQKRFLLAALMVSVLGNMPGELCAQPDQSPTRAALEKVADHSTVALTTIGRRSGKPHTKPIWFVYDQGRLYLQAGRGGQTDWYRNLKKNSQMTLVIDALTFSGKAKFITDPQETARVHELFRSKYLTARLLGLVGSSIGHGEVVEVELP
ncbi:MAG: pyridoxamine 5'-phosphate oxidase family protein [Candidatus Binatia bacterium]